jgi:hypothetical protein
LQPRNLRSYFTAHTNVDKRAKVIDWLLGDEAMVQHLGKILKVPPERIRVVRKIAMLSAALGPIRFWKPVSIVSTALIGGELVEERGARKSLFRPDCWQHWHESKLNSSAELIFEAQN